MALELLKKCAPQGEGDFFYPFLHGDVENMVNSHAERRKIQRIHEEYAARSQMEQWKKKYIRQGFSYGACGVLMVLITLCVSFGFWQEAGFCLLWIAIIWVMWGQGIEKDVDGL